VTRPSPAELFSIVIPTRNRGAFLGRLLGYYASQKVQVPILVADASDPDDMQVVSRAVEKAARTLNVKCKFYPSEVELVDKVSDLLTEVRTDCTVMAADDDFFAIAGLEAAARFLVANPDFNLAHGQSATFELEPGLVYGDCRHTASYLQRSIEQTTAAQRLKDHLSRYSTTWYSMHRTGMMRKNIETVAKLKLDPTSLTELLPSCLSLIQGKMKKLEALYMVRQVRPQPLSSGATAFDWITDPEWACQYKRFEDCLSGELAVQDKITPGEATEVVREAFWFHLARILGKKWQQQYGPSELRGKAAKLLPGLPSVVQRGRSFFSGEQNEMLLPALLRPTSRHHADFLPIYEAIRGDGTP
jgi:glycosyltransferase domain-containing protein